MSGWKAKRFWKTVVVVESDGGFGVTLDARPVRTPAKSPMALPTRAMAEAIAAEWEAVEKEVDPRRMPVTRGANAAIDKVAPQFDEVAELIAAYGGTDLLCYRAEAPEALAEAQAAAWDPLLDWAAHEYGARLNVTRGVVPVAQPAESLERLAAAVHSVSPFELTALHDLVSLSGSLVLGLAATRAEFDPETLWRQSRFDEDWQAEQWGEDEEAVAAARLKRDDFLFARHFWNISAESR
ncbi:ATP12 family protein [Defluviimonas sp. D31]|uniref:ATP12 family chaperone protein n=1 Tax=Defluviimonas sp. D31 TaxID=3083253 RepID=UPI00296FC631|nr:ATP12 family protein [Defluviimonas sp. D31]MDW4549765.1 ATP12 family protein [Defluviimonas sp. D31]